MLYNKKNEKELSPELFKNPTSEFRGAPFWAWNTELDDETLCEQIDNFRQMGIGGFHIHVRTGMATTYLSDEFMHYIKLCNEKAKKENMLCWLYDEDRWPSGAAGGYVTKNYRYRQRNLTFTSIDPFGQNGEQRIFAKDFAEYCDMCERGIKTLGYYVKKFDIILDEDGFLQSYRSVPYEAECKGRAWYAFISVAQDSGWYNGQAYIDTMNKEAVETFIKTTHEAFYKAVGEDFGKSIPAIFTDEPQVPRLTCLASSTESVYAALPFTDDFDETYKAKYGESILEKAPELVWESRDNSFGQTRYRYIDLVTERFVSAFVDTISEWCVKHNIAFTGHMMQEPTLQSQTFSLGEAMRCYRGFQLPGMDLLCDSVELTTAKQVQSAVRQYGREGMLSELYGVTGWDFPFRGHKRQGDWQAALGVTIRVHHLTWVSMNGDAKRDYPASIGYQSPWYKEYGYIENHFARLNTALTRGTPIVRVGVIHPIESYWLHIGANDKTLLRRRYLDKQFIDLTGALCYSGIDFDFIDESLFPALCEKGANPLAVGKMRYDCVIVPVMETIRSTTLERLNEFAKAGGKVIVLGKAPAMVDAVESSEAAECAEKWEQIDIDYNELIDRLEPFRLVSFDNTQTGSRCEYFVHQLRSDNGSLWLFFCHGENRGKYTPRFAPGISNEPVRVTLNGAYDITEYNTMTGEIYTPEYKLENGKTYFERIMFNEDSVLLKLTPTTDVSKLVCGNAPAQTLPVGIAPMTHFGAAAASADSLLRLDDMAEYTLDEPNAVLLDLCRYAFDGDGYSAEAVDSCRVAEIGRDRFYKKYKTYGSAQPWVPIPDELAKDNGHDLKRIFTFESKIDLNNVFIALEEADKTEIFINGQKIDGKIDGWYADKCIKTVKLPKIMAGKITVELKSRFGFGSKTEWCYILGGFGVTVAGKYSTVTRLPERLAYGNAVTQGLPFYTGNIKYKASVNAEKSGKYVLQVPDFGGAALKVYTNGVYNGIIAISPFTLEAELKKGANTVEIILLGTRYNGFGQVHNNVKGDVWLGPDSWKNYDSPAWSDAYKLKPTGIFVTPLLFPRD